MWLHIPRQHLPTSASSPGPEDSISPSNSLCQALAASVSLNMKSAPPKSWARVLRTGRYQRLLSGLTCEPSTAGRGAASWIGSLEERPARISPSRGSEKGSLGGEADCSSTSSALSTRRSLPASSGRTWKGLNQASLFTTGAKSSSILMHSSSPRIARKHLVNGGELNVTESAYTGDFSVNTGFRHCSMSRAAWSSAATRLRLVNSRRPTWARRIDGSGCSFWPTTQTSDANGVRMEDGKRTTGLNTRAVNWPSPRSEDAESAGNHPGAVDSLTGAAGLWGTPTSRDWKDGDATDADVPTNGLLGRQVTRCFLPDQETETSGSESSESGHGLHRRLNPAFGCWLMSWPWWWTHPAPLSFAVSEMVLWRSRAQRHLEDLCGE